MAKATVKRLDEGQLDVMWSFLRAGMAKPNIPALKEYCDQLRQAMIQKNAGQRSDDPAGYVSFDDIGTIINCIVIEAMALHLSGALDDISTFAETAKEAHRAAIRNGAAAVSLVTGRLLLEAERLESEFVRGGEKCLTAWR